MFSHCSLFPPEILEHILKYFVKAHLEILADFSVLDQFKNVHPIWNHHLSQQNIQKFLDFQVYETPTVDELLRQTLNYQTDRFLFLTYFLGRNFVEVSKIRKFTKIPALNDDHVFQHIYSQVMKNVRILKFDQNFFLLLNDLIVVEGVDCLDISSLYLEEPFIISSPHQTTYVKVPKRLIINQHVHDHDPHYCQKYTFQILFQQNCKPDVFTSVPQEELNNLYNKCVIFFEWSNTF